MPNVLDNSERTRLACECGGIDGYFRGAPKVAGASRYYERGVVAYRAAKIDTLGMPSSLYTTQGSVHREAVKAMAGRAAPQQGSGGCGGKRQVRAPAARTSSAPCGGCGHA